MIESVYKSYDELPLFLNAQMIADLLGVSVSSAYASFTLDTYTHMTTDMHKKAAGVVGIFLDEIM